MVDALYPHQSPIVWMFVGLFIVITGMLCAAETDLNRAVSLGLFILGFITIYFGFVLLVLLNKPKKSHSQKYCICCNRRIPR